MQSGLAPIVLFVYNRPEHTLITLQALKDTRLANESILYIYSDGFKKDDSKDQIDKIIKVRKLIRQTKWCKNVIIRESIENKGLANSIIEGVTEVIKPHGKVIVLEDDILISKGFLLYMNKALDLYDSFPNVVQITGYFPNLENYRGTHSSFFLPVTSTWGWATWRDRWEQIDFSPDDYNLIKSNNKLKKNFDLDNIYPYSQMLINQMEKKNISSWGIRFWWDSFKKKKLILFPDKSLLINMGFDGSGIHCADTGYYKNIEFDPEYEILSFPKEIIINQKAFNKYKSLMKKQTSGSLYNKVKNYIKEKLFI